MIILGLDPAATTGWAIDAAHYGVWQIAQKGDRHPGRRLERLRRLIYAAHRQHRLDAIALEDAGFGSNNRATAAAHNELRGVAKLVAAELEVPVLLVKPATLKHWLTGYGRATKEHMIEWVRTRFHVVTDDDNIADAVAVVEWARSVFCKGVHYEREQQRTLQWRRRARA